MSLQAKKSSTGSVGLGITRALAVLALLASAAYLAWRLSDTVAWHVWWVAIPLLLLESYSAVGLFVFTVSLWDTDSVEIPEECDATDLRIAVLIPTYNEPVEVLLPTIASAVALLPPHETWVLDDGNRPEIAALAEHLGARYLARPTREHAKAGNINYAIGFGSVPLREAAVQADLIVALDADHVAEAGLLSHTLGYFSDPGIALVQTPQEFYNTDSFEHKRIGRRSSGPAGHFYNEQALFYRAIQPGKNRLGGAFWCGTNAVVRVAALRDVGGVAVETLTEDLHTTVRMHRQGWRTVYHNEVLARGLAASDAIQYQNQRLRWGTGSMQLLRSRENPLFAPGFTASQRLSYAATLLGWFDAWRTLGFVLLPMVVLATGAVPVRANGYVFGAVFSVTFLLQQVALRRLGRGYAPQGIALVFEMIRMQVNLRATMTLFGHRRRQFSVTAKGAQVSGLRQRVSAPRLLVVLLGATAACLAWYAVTALGFGPLHYRSQGAAAAAAGWTLFGGVLLFIAARRAHSQQFAGERRASVRFESAAPARLSDIECTAIDISLTGAKLQVIGNRATRLRPQEQLSVWINGRCYQADVAIRSINPSEDGATIGVEYLPGDERARARLALMLFRSQQHELTGAAAVPGTTELREFAEATR
jgi:cellulose synthase/poly-beta-1,6-N-acetylglucosamine synthase-like glycosyltransferase